MHWENIGLAAMRGEHEARRGKGEATQRNAAGIWGSRWRLEKVGSVFLNGRMNNKVRVGVPSTSGTDFGEARGAPQQASGLFLFFFFFF